MRANPMIYSLLAASLALTAGACTSGDQPMIILQNQVPDEGCVIPTGISSTFLPRGIIDTNSSLGYIFNPVVQNNAIATDDAPNQRTILVEGADIELTIQPGVLDDSEIAAIPEGLLRFSQRFSGSIQPDGGATSFSFTIIPFELLADHLAGALDSPTQRAEVQAEITMFGTMGGGDVSSIPFFFPVSVCNGCLDVVVGACADLEQGFTPLTGGECNPAQDVATECCLAADDSLVCPAAPPATDPA